MNVFRRAHRDDTGASLMEMALVTPLLLLLALGVFDIGRALFNYISVQEAAQEGAVWASFEPFDPMQTRQRVVTSVDTPTINAGDVTISCPGGPNGDTIVVAVTWDQPILTPLIGNIVGGSIQLSTSLTGQIVSENDCIALP